MPADTSPAAIRCVGITKRFGAARALDGFDLSVAPGSILGLLGPSGCGKTTALRVVAGFEVPDSGTVQIGGRTVVGPGVFVPPEERRVGMVFQDYALFPHLSVRRNVAYGLGAGKDAQHRASEVLELVGLAARSEAMPHELSGGEQQRVALARALAPRPEVILLDEPFSNLDAPQRDRMRREVRTILVEARATAVFVTHDQEDALAMSDEVAVMREGAILQVASPDDVYHRPATPWVGRFLGEGTLISGEAARGRATTILGEIPLSTPLEGPVDVLVRPEAVRVTADPGGPVRIVGREFYGHDQLLTLELPDGARIQSRLGPTPVLLPGERVVVAVDYVVAFPKP